MEFVSRYDQPREHAVFQRADLCHSCFNGRTPKAVGVDRNQGALLGGIANNPTQPIEVYKCLAARKTNRGGSGVVKCGIDQGEDVLVPHASLFIRSRADRTMIAGS